VRDVPLFCGHAKPNGVAPGLSATRLTFLSDAKRRVRAHARCRGQAKFSHTQTHCALPTSADARRSDQPSPPHNSLEPRCSDKTSRSSVGTSKNLRTHQLHAQRSGAEHQVVQLKVRESEGTRAADLGRNKFENVTNLSTTEKNTVEDCRVTNKPVLGSRQMREIHRFFASERHTTTYRAETRKTHRTLRWCTMCVCRSARSKSKASQTQIRHRTANTRALSTMPRSHNMKRTKSDFPIFATPSVFLKDRRGSDSKIRCNMYLSSFCNL